MRVWSNIFCQGQERGMFNRETWYRWKFGDCIEIWELYKGLKFHWKFEEFFENLENRLKFGSIENSQSRSGDLTLADFGWAPGLNYKLLKILYADSLVAVGGGELL